MLSSIQARWRAWAGDPSKRLGIGFSIIVVFVLASYFWNSLRPLLNTKIELWDYPTFMPLIKPIGDDFREGYFYPAKIVLQGKDPYTDYFFDYPPFSAVFSIPFRLFDVDQAYLMQAGLLFVLNAVTIFISLKIAYEVFKKGSDQQGNIGRVIAYGLFPLLALLLFTSYGFYFSIERGNSDIYAQFFVVLGLWFLASRPKSVWLPVLFVSMGTHLKFYPAIIFVLIFWKFRWKSLLPIILTNAAFLLVLGPVRAWEFIRRIIFVQKNPFLFPANHSAASFSDMVNGFLVERAGIAIPTILFYLLPFLIWGLGVIVLWRRKYSPTNALLLFILSVPLMELIPSTSYDYKLVILASPLAIALFLLLQNFSLRGRLAALVEIIGLMFLMLLISRSYYFLPPVLTNKYPFILVMQSIFLLMLLGSPAREEAVTDVQLSAKPAPTAGSAT